MSGTTARAKPADSIDSMLRDAVIPPTQTGSSRGGTPTPPPTYMGPEEGGHMYMDHIIGEHYVASACTEGPKPSMSTPPFSSPSSQDNYRHN